MSRYKSPQYANWIIPHSDIIKMHGMGKHIVGRTWIAMMGRCFNKKHQSFPEYGARGITVCKFLRTSPANLLYLIGERPSGTSLDRTKNNKHYSCGGCEECRSMKWRLNIRWATKTQQDNNKRNNAIVTVNGKSLTVSQWASELGLGRNMLYGRWRKGITGKDFIAPKQEKRRFITYNGMTKSCEEWAKWIGIGAKAFGMRWARGWRGNQLMQPRIKTHTPK